MKVCYEGSVEKGESDVNKRAVTRKNSFNRVKIDLLMLNKVVLLFK